ncbi:hypothetical protein MPLSOD_340061 [Mesorhizobium sp. SOD10]|nr:hypothetical protein MPLSOD_340061 [Mesorhizobium sp. SOD10]
MVPLTRGGGALHAKGEGALDYDGVTLHFGRQHLKCGLRLKKRQIKGGRSHRNSAYISWQQAMTTRGRSMLALNAPSVNHVLDSL